jgi:hypothetical protein
MRALGRCRLRWENIKTDPKETRYENENWMCLVQDRVQQEDIIDTVMNLWLTHSARNLSD